MKRPLLLLSAIFISCITVKAQYIDQPRVRIGLKAGLNLSGFTRDVGVFDQHSATYDNSPYVGAQNFIRLTCLFGITVDYPINNKLSFATELLYNGRGGAYQIENPNVYDTDEYGNAITAYDRYNFQIDYVEAPLLLQYKISVGQDNSTYFLYGGIAPAILVKSRTNYNYYTGDAADASSTTKKGILYNVNGFNISPIAGLKIAWNHDAPRMPFLDIRMEYATLPVFNRTESNGYNLRTGMWTLAIGGGLRF
ncbi:PorT family protein [Mucilaginibacter sp. HMF5004]|uniref:porin family protein n=1 Tax=Mucilaginibacter rivuli TaxID=2857527 RepID=UPI001C5FFD2B|nr:porin family protein [Mucilaginibacter rivuli]MBW4891543.1 PorT family protein [Mucilaginibacter rivuli]